MACSATFNSVQKSDSDSVLTWLPETLPPLLELLEPDELLPLSLPELESFFLADVT